MKEAVKTQDMPDVRASLRKETIRPSLVQRLLVRQEDGRGERSPFTFGCVPKGGFTDEAYSILNKIFEFDYMGAGEFEWGAVPKAFAKLFDYASESKLVKKSLKPKEGEIFFICHKDVEEAVKAAVKKLLVNERGTMEYVGLKEAVQKAHSGPMKPRDIAGWIDIQNNFMFFVDKTMFENTATLFGVK